jgi:prepilin-type N-terminal cleavage/methylation domain-containing protein
MKTLNKRRGFTLVEAMIATGIGCVVLAAMITFFVQSILICRDVMAETYLMQQARLARERILRHMEDDYGLREADWSSINVWQDGMGMDFTVSETDNAWADDESATKRFCYLDPYAYFLTRYDMNVYKEMNITRQAGRVVDTELMLYLHIGDKVYTNRQLISTQIVN